MRAWALLAVIGMWVCVQAFDANRVLEAAASRSPRALAGARALLQMIERSQSMDELAKLAAVNDFFNRRIAYKTDWEVWGVEDYWASPLEMLDKGAGDCEDYAIGKYFSLLALNLPPAKLRLVYARVMLEGRSEPHMVLAYYSEPSAEPLILDNIQSQIKPASARPDLTPGYSFNTEGLWLGVGGKSEGKASRMPNWPGAIEKSRAEGF